MDDAPSTTKAARRLAAAALLLVLVVVAISAFIRLAAAARACPSCSERVPPALSRELALARGVHRASASLAALLVLALAVLALARRSLRRQLAPAAVSAAALVAILAALGPFSGGVPARAVALGNLLGGLALAVALAWLGGRTQPAPRGCAGLRPLASTACCIAAAQCVLGAWAASGAQPPPTGLLLAHAGLGSLTAVLAAALGVQLAQRRSRRLAVVLTLLAVLGPAAGLISALRGQALGAALSHTLATALVLVTLSRADGRLAAARAFA